MKARITTIKTGDILLVRHYSFIGKMIRKITDCEYNHVGVFVTPTQIVEATFGGVKLTDISDYEHRKRKRKLDYDIFTFKQPLTYRQKEIIVNFCVDKIGEKYDFFQFISLFFFFLFHINRKDIDPIDCRHAFICSELVAEAFEKAGVTFNSNIDIDNVTPADIARSDIIRKIT